MGSVSECAGLISFKTPPRQHSLPFYVKVRVCQCMFGYSGVPKVSHPKAQPAKKCPTQGWDTLWYSTVNVVTVVPTPFRKVRLVSMYLQMKLTCPRTPHSCLNIAYNFVGTLYPSKLVWIEQCRRRD